MTFDPTRLERLRTALLAARDRVYRNAKLRLFAGGGRERLPREELEQRRQAAFAIAQELEALAAESSLEHLRFHHLRPILKRLQSLGLIISGPELRELSAAFFAVSSDIAA
ncbi:hypothetical protein [Solirhodobacter olei]|uniref:hypothetical protein n=1 Tax=Solirhodobacter olei TaxID=2493082 RepID=UPI000FDB940A|nr:hypothetical protein [Solirhodobacter olei]